MTPWDTASRGDANFSKHDDIALRAYEENKKLSATVDQASPKVPATSVYILFAWVGLFFEFLFLRMCCLRGFREFSDL